MGYHYGELREALARGPIISLLLVVSWLLYPVAIQTCLHPSDAVGLQYWLQSQPVPHLFTWSMLKAGEICALMALIGLSLLIFGLTVLLYHRAGFFVQLWPLAGLLLGVFGNAGWWIGKGFFDGQGAVIGWSPLVLMGLAYVVCQRMGADFVFGKGNRPARKSWGL